METTWRVGGWTFADLADLPGDHNRYEIIDGNLLVTPPPAIWHQSVGSHLLGQLLRSCPEGWSAVYASYVDYGGDCRIPDLLVVRTDRARDRRALAYLPGEIGLAVEIVSPSSRRTDRLAKPAEYAEVGIPLMWRVELEPDVVLHPFRLVDGNWQAGSPVSGKGVVDAPWGTLEIDLTALR